MKTRTIIIGCLLALLITVSPFFAPSLATYKGSRLLLFMWALTLILFIIPHLIMIPLQSIHLEDCQDTEVRPAHAQQLSKTKQRTILSIMMLVITIYINNNFDRLVQGWQIAKMERIIEKYDLYNQDEAPSHLNHYNQEDRWFQINYAELYPEKLRYIRNMPPTGRDVIAGIHFKDELMIECWDCHIYYTKMTLPEAPNSAPFRLLKEGKNGYNWYKFCQY